MTNTDVITALIQQLKTIRIGLSDSQCRRNYSNAYQFIQNSELGESIQNGALKVLRANCDSNGGYHYNSDGIPELITHLEAVHEIEANNQALNAPAFNIHNMTAFLDGQSFSFGGA